MPTYTITPFPLRPGDRRPQDLTVEQLQQRVREEAGKLKAEVLGPMSAAPTAEQQAQGNLGLGPAVLFSVRSAFSLAKKLFLDANQANPSAAELGRGQRPDGSYEAPAVGTGDATPAVPHVLPVWLADP